MSGRVVVDMSAGLAYLASRKSGRFPLAARALKRPVKTACQRFVWGEGARSENVTQLFRFAVAMREPDEGTLTVLRAQMFEDALGALDDALLYGQLHVSERRRSMAGVRQLLGRDPVESDVLTLRVLHPPVLRLGVPTHGVDGDELSFEVGLQVEPNG